MDTRHALVEELAEEESMSMPRPKILANYRLGADASFSSLFPAGEPQCLSSGVSLRVVADKRWYNVRG